MISHSEMIDGIPMPDQQGTRSWLEWRKSGIGGSDVAAVLGISKWSTPYQLWLEKTGRKAPFQGNFATARGQELEPLARAAYELEHGADFTPALVVHHEYSFMRVSLDGYNEELSRVLEIKCPGEADHKLAVNGQVPEQYVPQLQYQLYVTGAKEAHYYSFDGISGVTVVVYPDMAKQMRIVTAVKTFWENHILKDVAPELSHQDALEVEDVDGEMQRYAKLKTDLVLLEKRLDETREKLLSRYGGLHSRIRGGGIEIVTTERRGSVDYSKVKELQSLNLDDYRKPSQQVVTIKLV